MKKYRSKVLEAAEFIKNRIPKKPSIGIITGTGLGDMASCLERSTSMDYSRIPNFPVSTVQSHEGKMVVGDLSGKIIVALKGRFHLYEGYQPQEVAFPVRVMAELGVSVLIISNAAGGLNPGFRPGQIMVVSDHINLTGLNPLTGQNDGRWGIRFPDMACAYDKGLSLAAREAGLSIGEKIQQGVYAGLIGPSLETPAETRFLRMAGADAVGFSTIMESIAAVHAGMKILALSVITNINNPEIPQPVTVAEVLETAAGTVPVLMNIITNVVERTDGI